MVTKKSRDSESEDSSTTHDSSEDETETQDSSDEESNDSEEEVKVSKSKKTKKSKRKASKKKSKSEKKKTSKPFNRRDQDSVFIDYTYQKFYLNSRSRKLEFPGDNYVIDPSKNGKEYRKAFEKFLGDSIFLDIDCNMAVIHKCKGYEKIVIYRFFKDNISSLFRFIDNPRQRTAFVLSDMIRHIVNTFFIMIEANLWYRFDGSNSTWILCGEMEFKSFINSVIKNLYQLYEEYYTYREDVMYPYLRKNFLKSAGWKDYEKAFNLRTKNLDMAMKWLGGRLLTGDVMNQYAFKVSGEFQAFHRHIRSLIDVNRRTLNFLNLTVHIDTCETIRRSNIDMCVGCTNCDFIIDQDKLVGETLTDKAKNMWPEMMEYFMELGGKDQRYYETLILILYLIINPTNYHKFIYFIYGPGNSGKTTLIHLLHDALGDNSLYVSQLPSGVLSAQTRSASSHDGKMVMLNEGVRYLWMDETSNETVFDPVRVKEFANGRCHFMVRGAYDSKISKMILSPNVLIATNGTSLPYIKDSKDDDAIYNRLVGFEVKCRYVSSKKAKKREIAKLKSSLKQELIDLELEEDTDEYNEFIENGKKKVKELKRSLVISDPKRHKLIKSKTGDLLSLVIWYGSKLYHDKINRGEELFDHKIVKNKEFIKRVTTSKAEIKNEIKINEWFDCNYEPIFDNKGQPDKKYWLNMNKLKLDFIHDGGVFEGKAEFFAKTIRYANSELPMKKLRENKGALTIYGFACKCDPYNNQGPTPGRQN